MTLVQLDRQPRILQGAGALDQLGGLARDLLGRDGTVLLAADPGLRAAGLAERAAGSLARAGLGVVVFEAFKSDPTMAQADEAAAIARRERASLVVALGGGSALDIGKAIAGICGSVEPAAHYGLCAHPFPAQRLPCICVPTTSGTGSEATRTAVLADADGAKIWLWGDELKAALVLLDPELTTALPATLTAATGIDALVHAIEACTNANANAANDMYCHEAIRLVARHLRRAVEHPADIEARAGMQRAATLAGIGIDNCGTAIAHNIGHALASLRPVHHGRAVGLAMRVTLAWNAQQDDGRFVRAAAALGAGTAAALPAEFERLLRESGVRVSLRGEGHDGLAPGQLAAQMAKPENAAMLRSNLRQPGEADLLRFAQDLLAE